MNTAHAQEAPSTELSPCACAHSRRAAVADPPALLVVWAAHRAAGLPKKAYQHNTLGRTCEVTAATPDSRRRSREGSGHAAAAARLAARRQAALRQPNPALFTPDSSPVNHADRAAASCCAPCRPCELGAAQRRRRGQGASGRLHPPLPRPGRQQQGARLVAWEGRKGAGGPGCERRPRRACRRPPTARRLLTVVQGCTHTLKLRDSFRVGDRTRLELGGCGGACAWPASVCAPGASVDTGCASAAAPFLLYEQASTSPSAETCPSCCAPRSPGWRCSGSWEAALPRAEPPSAPTCTICRSASGLPWGAACRRWTRSWG